VRLKNGKEVGSLQGGRAKPTRDVRLLWSQDAAHQSGVRQEAFRDRHPNDSRRRPEARLPSSDEGLRVHFLRQAPQADRKKGLDNVETVLVTEDSLTLPEKSLDLVFMRNVTHHIPNRVEYFGKLKALLKPEGRIAIIEYRRGGRFSFRRMFGHYVPREIIIEEMSKAGYRLEEDLDFLSEQSFTIFSLKV